MGKKKRLIWHSYFEASLLLALVIAVIFSSVDYLSGAGIIMFASLAASALTLTHKYRHHLTTLGTITSAYILAGAVSIGLVILLRLGGTPLFNQVIIVLAVLAALLYWLNLFHVPAISFALAFIIFNKGIENYIFVLLATLVLFIALRLAVYVYHEHLDIRHFFKEFIKEEKKLVRKEKKRVKKGVKRI